MTSVNNAQDSEKAIDMINIGDVEVSENDTIQPQARKMTSMYKGKDPFDFDIINIGQVNEGFESEIKPKKIHHNSIEQTIDGNNEGKKQFFLS